MYYAQFRAFHAVATYGGFSKAANELGLTQPAISDQVRKLEERFGILLFNRHKRLVTPTELGQALFEITKRQFEYEKQAIELLSESQKLRVGHLNITADSPLHIIQTVGDFRRKHPGVSVSLKVANSQNALYQIFDFTADVAVLAEPPGDDRLEFIPLRSDPLVAFVENSHPLAQYDSITLDHLREEALVFREGGSRTIQTIKQEFADKGITPKVVMDVDGLEALKDAVAAGIGVGFVTQPEFGYDRRLKAIPIDDCTRLLTESVVCMKDRAHLGAIKAFMQATRDYIKNKGDV
ncbi:LysR substrate-binding domain-containing protein [Curvivirga sp.]|uniref:LysR substrate-binding domain-containing protein n=1 Tax=Curvivirga sp. TaxID=2856848 RepID=UPI003B5B7220